MKKERFIGYLEHMRDIAAEQYYSEDVEEVVELLDEIIKKAEQLDEPLPQVTPVYPTYPEPWWQKPWITTYTSDSISWNPKDNPINFELDITDSISYNCKIPEPNQWSVEKDSKLPSNWKIIK